eukprot:1394664-Amorphochlora_amoeboformis.AAC.1
MGLGLGSDYSACLSPRTIDSSRGRNRVVVHLTHRRGKPPPRVQPRIRKGQSSMPEPGMIIVFELCWGQCSRF